MTVIPITKNGAFYAMPDIQRKARLCIPDSEGVHILKVANIKRMEASGNYTKIIFKSGQDLLIAKTLKELEDRVRGMGFLRIHKSHLVRLELITFVGGTFIKIEGDELLPLARRRKCSLQLLLNKVTN